MAVEVMTWVWERSQSRHAARLVMLAIADHMSDGHSWAWPSIAALAVKTQLKERALQLAIADLEKSGELEVDRGGGPKGCNRYRVLMTDPAKNAPPPQKMHPPRKICTPAESAPPVGEFQQVRPQDPAKFAPPAESAPPAKFAPGTVIKPENLDSPSENQHAHARTRGTPRTPKAGSDDDPDFTEFWRVYPRKVAKGQARTAWHKATVTRKTDPARIIKAAMLFGEKITAEGKETEFIPHPATWLNGERYDDTINVTRRNARDDDFWD